MRPVGARQRYFPLAIADLERGSTRVIEIAEVQVVIYD